jgi:hypothetical protein
VSDPDDIVTRLRAVLHNDKSVELLNREAADEIERLRAERDEARRMFCDQSFGNRHAVACELGWSCYPEPADAP